MYMTIKQAVSTRLPILQAPMVVLLSILDEREMT